MKRVLDFLNTLYLNNNKEWFHSHKEEYIQAQGIFNNFSEQLISGIASFDPSVRGLGLKDCTYRIYRDTRFSKDKTPYKTHMGAFVAPRGKSSGLSGYYFHIEAKGGEYLCRHMLVCGTYCPTPAELRSIREDICYSPKQFRSVLEAAPDFQLDMSNSITRVPTGFPKDAEYAEVLKLRTLFLTKYMEDSDVCDPHLLERSIEAFRQTKPFNDFVNRAIYLAREES